mgnify:FL=1
MFWWFCDNYVELVKSRAYGDGGDGGTVSARRSLRAALGALQRLLAPVLPFAAEEAWSWWHTTSIHTASWPTPTALDGDPMLIDPVVDVLTHVRRAKTEAKRSQRAAVAAVDVTVPDDPARAAVVAGTDDLIAAGSIDVLTVARGEAFDCAVELAAE